MKEQKRYHIAYNDACGKWVCHDYVGGTYGIGNSVMESYWDCCEALEVAASYIDQ